MFLKPTSGLHDKGGRIALSVTIMAGGTMIRSLIDCFGPIGEVHTVENTRGGRKEGKEMGLLVRALKKFEQVM